MSSSRLLYLDCFAGISGDMFLGLLLDLGYPEEELRRDLSGLALDGWQLGVAREKSGHLGASRVTITVAACQPRRHWWEIRQLLTAAPLPEKVRDRGLAVFAALAEAEARVHDCDPEEVHFHEVGAVDSLIDIIGVLLGVEYFGIGRLCCSPLPMPRGFVDSEHGRLPLPAPAVCELLKGLPVYGVDLEQELVTPTGAALLKTLAGEFGPLPGMIIEQVGYGRGRQNLADGRPNLLRGLLGHPRVAAEASEVEVITCNLDDWNPEGFPYLSEQLFALGVLDVALVPIQMKKGRPGLQLQIICRAGEGFEARRLLLTETTAIGLRYHREERWTLPRRQGFVESEAGRVAVKLVTTPAGPVLYPEYEDCRRLALATGRPLKEIYAAVQRCRLEAFEES